MKRRPREHKGSGLFFFYLKRKEVSFSLLFLLLSKMNALLLLVTVSQGLY